MKKSSIIILPFLLFLFLGFKTLGCDGTSFSLVSGPSAISGGRFSVVVRLCTTSGYSCQAASTGNFWFGAMGTTFDDPSSSTSVTSPHTSAVYTQTPLTAGGGYTDLMRFNNSTSWFAPNTGGACVTACVNITLVFNSFPTSVTALGIEGADNSAAGCTGLRINFPNSLPIELVSFDGENMGGINHLQWITASEINNDYFILENSTDGNAWNTVGMVNGAGNSTTENTYDLEHRNNKEVVNYYRLTQVDFDGNREVFNTISIDNGSSKEKKTLIKVTNLMGQEVNEYYHGLILKIYSDGTCIKEFK